MSSLFSNKKFKGFTLIELMVTVGIFVFMTALMLAKYNNFYSGTIFTNLAYDIALTIRQAQSYGISVKVNENNDSFNYAYGVRFDVSDTTNSKKISLNSYTGTKLAGYAMSATEKTYNIKRGAYISSLCLNTDCTSGPQNGVLDIIFQRPNPETIICTGTAVTSCNNYKYAKIIITAGDGVTTHTIEVNGVGQISVN